MKLPNITNRARSLLLYAASLLCVAAAGAIPAAASSDAKGDFNRDGYADLATGVPGEDVDGLVDAGAVNVIYGGPQGLDATAGPGNQFLTQANINPPVSVARAGNRFGAALAAGDFNGDAYADLGIGIPGNDVERTIEDAGAVYVIYGGSDGLSGDSISVQFWSQASASSEGEIAEDPEPGDAFGSSLAAGDFDDDSFTDLAIGVPREDIGDAADAGAVNIIYGHPYGLSATAGPGNQLWSQDTPGIEGVAESYDQFGFSLAAGNFGYGSGGNENAADLAIGVPFENVTPEAGGTATDAGAVHVLYGARDAGLSVETANNNAEMWVEDELPRLACEPDDLFGYALTTGDFKEEGYTEELDDLAIGVPGQRVDGGRAGAVVVLYSAHNRGRGGLSSAGAERWTQNSDGIQDAAEDGDKFGQALAAGDFNGDDAADLAIGAPYEDVENVRDAGAVHVLFGSSTGLVSPGNQWFTGAGSGGGRLVTQGGRFGSSLTARNFGGEDRFSPDDLAVGAPADGVLRTLFPRPRYLTHGAVHVLYGARDVGLTEIGKQVWSQASAGILDDREDGDGFGQALD
jgi:hypothetical protein